MSGNRKASHTYNETLQQARRYCASQERCTSQVRNKLRQWGLLEDELEKLIAQLTEEDFINDMRYARIYVESKFRINKWGKFKIKFMLDTGQIAENIVLEALEKIDDEEYRETLVKILLKKSKEIKDKNPFIKAKKVANFAIQKGFEQGLVWETIKKITLD